MNITIDRTCNDSKVRQISFRLAALAAACTLGIAGVAATTGTFSGHESVSVPVAKAANVAPRPQTTTPRLHIVLVDSPELKERFDNQITVDSMLAGTFGAGDEYIVVVKGTGIEDTLTSAFSASRMVAVSDTTITAVAASPAVSVQPLFSTAADAEYAAQSLNQLADLPRAQVVPAASAADIAASVLSTELATYAVNLAASERQALDAQIMAGVVSTERGAWAQ
jgi:hypothetical protein